MTPVAPSVVPILATPLGIASIADSAALNPALSETFARRMTADNRQQRSPLRFSGTEDLLEWPESPVRQFAQGLAAALYSVIGGLNEFTEAQLLSLKMEARAWFTVIRTNGSVPAANYPLTAWCAIYCVTAPTQSDTRLDSGVVRLYESRLGTMFQDASNATMRIPYRHAHYSWRPVAGNLIIFPASLTHEISLLRAEGDLTLITAKIRFVGTDQKGIGRW
jgi:hypothetical protein